VTRVRDHEEESDVVLLKELRNEFLRLLPGGDFVPLANDKDVDDVGVLHLENRREFPEVVPPLKEVEEYLADEVFEGDIEGFVICGKVVGTAQEEYLGDAL